MNINQLKILKYNKINTDQERKDWLRYFYRYTELILTHSFARAHIYIANRIISKLIIRLSQFIEPIHKLPDNNMFCILITGGVGDSIVIARLIRDIQKYLNYQFDFDVYFHSPNMIRPIFKNICGFRDVLHENIYHYSKSHYMFSMSANTLVTFNNELINYSLLLLKSSEVLKLFSNIELFRKKENLDKFIRNHPFLDGAFADVQSKLGRVRYSFMHEMMGLEYSGHKLNIDVDIQVLKKYDLNDVNYITIHDGWDENFKFISSRPTKAIPLNVWSLIIANIKNLYPNHLIVQIGGPKGEVINGVDICLKNKTPFLDAISILSFSHMHFDSESGLVHLASALGVRSMVFFGPTNFDWFSYPENVNIKPSECGNCWWSTENWMNSCPLGYIDPICINHDQNIINFFDKKEIVNVQSN